MKLTDKEKLENLTREFEKLIGMLMVKFPEAYKYYTKRLRINDKVTYSIDIKK